MTTMEEKYTRRRYHSSIVTTVVSITLVLVMIGLLALTVFHAKKLSDYVRENIGFRVYLKSDAPEEDIILLQTRYHRPSTSG
ncbi:MAG: hypothetical protein MUC31_09100 [Bacteroidales bacterium]|nr:hypothetical protein [Bacteroidales bacterium]